MAIGLALALAAYGDRARLTGRGRCRFTVHQLRIKSRLFIVLRDVVRLDEMPLFTVLCSDRWTCDYPLYVMARHVWDPRVCHELVRIHVKAFLSAYLVKWCIF